ncbi:YqhA family protein [Dictyobacter formicarum]|uniref:YqhA family protein n=1 Tax=Dictyobacter formicarum TaxID=2778368 RepID=A0ABQ3VP67_9CHLR|nr:YqhA family protein [Dictyobacter formicarum]GHO87459.1 hypothetical protein KSZ_54650 [Dictyobacter formicarum]
MPVLRRVLSGSRYLILIAVAGSLLASIILLLYGAAMIVKLAIEVATHPIFTTEDAKPLAVACIEVIDLFLLATVLYIIALGLYELFIGADLPTLPWLIINTLDDLKVRLIGVVIVLLSVTFLASVVEWKGNTNILTLGAGIGLVLLALGYILRQVDTTHMPDEQGPLHEPIRVPE